MEGFSEIMLRKTCDIIAFDDLDSNISNAGCKNQLGLAQGAGNGPVLLFLYDNDVPLYSFRMESNII